MPLVSGGVPTRQRGFPKCPAVLGWVAAGQNGFLQFAEEPKKPHPIQKSLALFVLEVVCYGHTEVDYDEQILLYLL